MHKNLPNIPANPYRFVSVSGNKKTGPVPVVSTAAQSCPNACPMKTDNEGGCYAASGNSAIHWRSLTNGTASTALDLEGLTRMIGTITKGQLWRMNEAGDLMSEQNNPENIDTQTLAAIVHASRHAQGFTYTHHALNSHNVSLIRESNRRGFTVNVSTNNPKHADDSAALAPGLPMVTLVNADAWKHGNITRTPQGRVIVRCPTEHIDGMTCARCKLCANNGRASIVGFTPHGTSKARVIRIAQG